MNRLRGASAFVLALMLALTLGAGELQANLKGPGRVARKRLSSSVVQITVYDWRGIFVRQGWGFFINREGHVITPRSLLEGGFYVEVTTVRRENLLVDKVYAEDTEGNFIRLGLEFLPDRFTYLERSAPLPAAGERVLVGGGQGCEPGAFLDGIVEDVRKVPLYGSLVRIGSPFATTGSPVFNESGVLVAVVMFRLESGDGSAWAVPVGRIAKVMNGSPHPVEHLAWAEKRQGEWTNTAVGSYMTGLAYYWCGQYGPAIPRLARASRDDRFRREAFFLLGCCNDAIGQYGSSVEAYSMAIRTGHPSREMFLKLARALLIQGDRDGALEAAWTAVRASPDCYEAYTMLSDAYNAQGNHQNALAAAYIALKIDPGKAEAYLQLGVSQAGQKNYEQAIRALEKCIEIDPQNGKAYWELALAYFRSGDRPSAERICRALEEVDSGLSRQLAAHVMP